MLKSWLPDIPGFIESEGYVAIWLLMWLETIIPIFPSEIVLPLGALAVSHGKMSLWGVALAGTAGAMTGSLMWYGLARWLGLERFTAFVTRFGRWTTLSPALMARLQGLFVRYGTIVVFACRLIPGIRSLISIPAGIVKMPFLPFFIYSFAGASLWSGAVTYAGWLFRDDIERLHHLIQPVVGAIVVGLALVWLYRVITYKKSSDVLPLDL
jgi:membrane protein DedA with SNARE-associated domain